MNSTANELLINIRTLMGWFFLNPIWLLADNLAAYYGSANRIGPTPQQASRPAGDPAFTPHKASRLFGDPVFTPHKALTLWGPRIKILRRFAPLNETWAFVCKSLFYGISHFYGISCFLPLTLSMWFFYANEKAPSLLSASECQKSQRRAGFFGTMK